MAYFNSRDVAAMAALSVLWGVLGSTFAPIVFRMTGLPILCDAIGFAVLVLAVWWVRKLGAATVVGIVATLINFMFNPGGAHFLGFTAASAAFDGIARGIGYGRSFKGHLSTAASMLPTSIASAAVAGAIIAAFFMAAPALARWGGPLGWVGLHAAGGAVGGAVGVGLVAALAARGVRPTGVEG